LRRHDELAALEAGAIEERPRRFQDAREGTIAALNH
jgi:hypothetical protein